MSDDYQMLKNMVEAKKREALLKEWITKKQKSTYVRISEKWRNCDFQFPEWIK
jgi:peptidyl-prolyl cis-trans isomerase SurA